MGDLLSPTNFEFLLQGFKLTFFIATISIVFSIIIGVVLGIIKTYIKGILNRLVGVYIEVVRNTPLLLWIFLIRFVGNMEPIQAGIVAFTIFTSATIGEIVRGGLNSIDYGQWEAGQSQGFTTMGILRYIILPQTFRNIIPTIASQMTSTIKDTSLLWSVGIQELTGKGMILMGKYTSFSNVFAIFIIIALFYFIINIIVSNFSRSLQKKLKFSTI